MAFLLVGLVGRGRSWWGEVMSIGCRVYELEGMGCKIGMAVSAKERPYLYPHTLGPREHLNARRVAKEV